ncbi:MAG: hypothetical protein ACXVAX_07470 [Pseudobdellovibrio sp.]
MKNSDKKKVQYLDSISSILFNVILLSTLLIVVKYIYVTYFFLYKKKQLITTNSMISAYKLKLKTKVAARFASFNGDKSELYSILKPIEKKIMELSFDKAEDYTTLFNSILEITDLVGLNSVITGKQNFITENHTLSVAPEYHLTKTAYEKAFEFDKDVMIFIIEIKQSTDEYLRLAAEYNHYTEFESNVKKIMNLPEPIEIASFPILLDVYNQFKSEIAIMRSLQEQGSELNDLKKSG